MMRYAVAIEPGSKSGAFGVVVPDLPGCSATGDTIASAMANAEAAIIGWISATLDAGLPIPAPSNMVDVQADPAFADWHFGLIPVDVALLAAAGGRQ
jgi:predicted RNase H-like HicB family nuclease